MRPAPGLYPAEQPRPSSSFAEPTVWKALRTGLPPNWFAWHALRLRNGAAGHTELDFVLAHPERGVLVLEVKGGRMEVRDGHW